MNCNICGATQPEVISVEALVSGVRECVGCGESLFVEDSLPDLISRLELLEDERDELLEELEDEKASKNVKLKKA